MTTPTTGYPEAVRELSHLVQESTVWGDYLTTWPVDDRPTCAVGHFDFEVEEPASGGQTRRSDFIVFQQTGGMEYMTNDGWVGLSKQVIEVAIYSQSRKRASDMVSVVHQTLTGYQGQPRANGPTVRACLFDHLLEAYEEEASYYALSMLYVVMMGAE